MRRLVSLLLALVLAVAMMPAAAAAGDEAANAADALNALGLFSGTGTDAAGKPIYDLGRQPTRQESITMLVKLVGGAQESSKGGWKTPFTDVDDWAKNWVGYAYAKGLTAGTSATTFGANDKTTAAQYLTFLLKALGYDATSDFSWDKAWELSDRIGLTGGEYGAQSTFTRGDMAILSNRALDVKMKGTTRTLRAVLVEQGALKAVTVTVGLPKLETVQSHSDNALTRWIQEQTGYKLDFTFFASETREWRTQVETILGAGLPAPDLLYGTVLYGEVRCAFGEYGKLMDLMPWFNSKMVMNRYDFQEQAAQYYPKTTLDRILYLGQAANNGLYGFPCIRVTGEEVKYGAYIPSNSKHPEAAFQILMLLSSREGAARVRYGQPGVDWVWDGETICVLNDSAFAGKTSSTWGVIG